MTAFHVCIQHCDNTNPMTEKTQLKTNNWINMVQTYFESLAIVLLKCFSFYEGKDHTARENASVTAANVRNLLKSTF